MFKSFVFAALVAATFARRGATTEPDNGEIVFTEPEAPTKEDKAGKCKPCHKGYL